MIRDFLIGLSILLLLIGVPLFGSDPTPFTLSAGLVSVACSFGVLYLVVELDERNKRL
jgi:hypothetical protein